MRTGEPKRTRPSFNGALLRVSPIIVMVEPGTKTQKTPRLNFGVEARDLDDQLVKLQIEGEPIQAVALIHRELGLPLAQAKQYLHDHPAWREDLEKWAETLDKL